MLKELRSSMSLAERDSEYLSGDSEWNQIHPDDLWVYNKLILSTKLGYKCGPAGTTVPGPNDYIVRPTMNLMGMGINARTHWIQDTTDHLNPGSFWCEIFKGEHISVDFHNRQPELIVKGLRHKHSPLWQWEKWYKVDRLIMFPSILQNLSGDYEWINCEFIGRKLIEVHFRRNPAFRFANSIAIPVRNESEAHGKNFVEDRASKRCGFHITAK